MKKSFLFSYVLAGMMLASCSSSDDVATGTHGFAEDGTGYVKVSLNLPTRSASSTRGVNDDTADGEADEYNVNDATLIIFAGDNEADATFQSAYDLTGTVKTDYDNDQVTSQYTVTQEVKSVSGANNIYAFVVLNHNDAFAVTTANGLKVNGTGTGTGTELTTSDKFSTFSKLAINKPIANDNIMMTNAVVTTQPGSAAFADPTTLANVTTNVYPTKAEAEANPAADIFVERMAAKVTLSCSGGTTASGSTPATKFGYSLVGWELGNYNTQSYVSRQWDNSWNSYKSSGDGVTSTPEALDANPYRFAGTTLIKAENGNPSGNFYRTYFGMDANYTTEANFTDHPSTITDLVSTTQLTSGQSTYCYENTFDVSKQTVLNTTVALVKMKITPDGWSATDFYTKDGNRNVIYTEADAKALVSKQLLSDFTAADLKAKYFSTTTDAGTISADVSFYTTDASGTTSSEAGTQKYSVTLKFTKTGETSPSSTATVDAADEIGGKKVLETLATNIKISKYKDCYSYYKILIKHFGDELTPWNLTSNTTENANDFLGRYGVLRNNWYDISVTGVSNIGDATPGDLDVNKDPTKDDKTTQFISCRINVLSWAKRTQSTVLGE